MEVKEVIHKNHQPLKVLLQKTQNGYNWEIHVQGRNLSEILPVLRDANAAIRKEYGKVA